MFLHSMSIICNYRMPQDTEHEMDDIEVIFATTKKKHGTLAFFSKSRASEARPSSQSTIRRHSCAVRSAATNRQAS